VVTEAEGPGMDQSVTNHFPMHYTQWCIKKAEHTYVKYRAIRQFWKWLTLGRPIDMYIMNIIVLITLIMF